MSEKERKLVDKVKAAEERRLRMEKRAYDKAVKERAKKIEAKKKIEESHRASEARRARMEARKLLKAQDAAARKARKRDIESQRSIVGLPLSEFSVTARKYETLLTRKYESRKKWEEPSPYEIISYIPGTIISVDVKEGDVVEEGAQLLILEAMKMQNRIDMPFTARVKKININEGERIPKEYVMIELEALDS